MYEISENFSEKWWFLEVSMLPRVQMEGAMKVVKIERKENKMDSIRNGGGSHTRKMDLCSVMLHF